MAQGIAKVQLATDDVEGEGDTAWECGRYVLETADGQVADRGKFLVIWKRVDGNWHLHRDMINTNLPAEGA
jgi:ketosteroid isomerase-like protein